MSSPCHAIAESLALFHSGLLEDSEALAVSNHLEACAECRAKAAQYASLSAALTGIGHTLDFPEPTPLQKDIPEIHHFRFGRRSYLALAAVAAMFLVFTGIAWQTGWFLSTEKAITAEVPFQPAAIDPTPQSAVVPPPTLFEYHRHLSRSIDVEELLDAQYQKTHREPQARISLASLF